MGDLRITQAVIEVLHEQPDPDLRVTQTVVEVLESLVFSPEAGSATSDSFNRADGPLGSNWETNTGSGLRVTGSKVTPNATGYVGAHFVGAEFSDNHSSQITRASAGQDPAPAVRASAGGNWYAWFADGTVRKSVGGSVSTIGSLAAFENGNTAKLEVIGEAISAFLNDVHQGTINDGDLPNGAPGIVFKNDNGNGPSADDWEGEDLEPPLLRDPRKIGRLVSVRGSGTPHSHQLRTGRITVVGAGSRVTVVVKGGETYTNIPKWSRLSPLTTGWKRT